MSETNPPVPFPLNPIFNVSDWIYPDITLTIAVANSLYLKKAGDSASGIINFNSGLTCAGTCQISCNVLLNGALASNRQITASYLNLNDITNNASVLQVYPTSTGVVYYDNNFNSGSHQFAVNNSSGTQSIPFSLNSTGVIISTNNPLSASSSFTVADATTTNQFNVIPNVGGGLYNASTDAGNILLLGTSNTISSETIQLSTWSGTNNYVKIRPTSVGMGAGSASSTATTSVECNGTTVRITPSITFPDNTVQTTAFSGVVSSTTYTVQYTSTQSITLPTNCIGIGVRCIGQGGTAGVSSDGNAGTWGAGGSGGGGGTVYNMGIIPLYAGTVIQLNFAGYTEILLTTFGSVSLCRANVGGSGGNGSGSNGGVAGGGGGSSNLNTTYGDWSTKIGSNGIAGGSNLSNQNYALIPSTAGSPVGIIFSDTAFGCGQRWGSGGINAPQNPPIPKPTGVCYITYYIKN